jgi:predicted anti-sigma-YlaC factor YlaD
MEVVFCLNAAQESRSLSVAEVELHQDLIAFLDVAMGVVAPCPTKEVPIGHCTLQRAVTSTPTVVSSALNSTASPKKADGEIGAAVQGQFYLLIARLPVGFLWVAWGGSSMPCHGCCLWSPSPKVVIRCIALDIRWHEQDTTRTILGASYLFATLGGHGG